MNNNFQWFTHTPFLSNEQCDDVIKKLQEETNWVSGYEGAHIVNANEKSFDNIVKDRTFVELYAFQNTKHDYTWINDKLEPYVEMLNKQVWNFNIRGVSGLSKWMCWARVFSMAALGRWGTVFLFSYGSSVLASFCTSGTLIICGSIRFISVFSIRLRVSISA